MNIKLDVLLVQIIHVALLIWMFKKIMGDSLTAAIVARKEQISKLNNADAEYARLITQAKTEGDMLLADAIATKKQLIEEGKQLGEQKKDEIIAAATYEAQMIKAQADSNRQEQTQQLYDQFESMVKKTANAGLKKLIGSRADVYQDYMNKITEEIK